MLFIDLNSNKIIKEFKYSTKETSIILDLEAPMITIKNIFDITFSGIIAADPLAVNYIIDLGGEGAATEDEINAFLTIINIGCAEFFRHLTLDKPRDRERRLDVPQSLKGIKTNMSLLKKAVNNQTINNVFNLTIKYKDLFFTLCDEKEEVKKEDFVHSLDELEVSNNVA